LVHDFFFDNLLYFTGLPSIIYAKSYSISFYYFLIYFALLFLCIKLVRGKLVYFSSSCEKTSCYCYPSFFLAKSISYNDSLWLLVCLLLDVILSLLMFECEFLSLFCRFCISAKEADDLWVIWDNAKSGLPCFDF